MKEAQELLRKVDSDLNQKYSPDFKDRYQIELLLRELDVSVVVVVVGGLGHDPVMGSSLCAPLPVRTRKKRWTNMSTWFGAFSSGASRWCPSSTVGRRPSSPSRWRHSATLRETR